MNQNKINPSVNINNNNVYLQTNNSNEYAQVQQAYNPPQQATNTISVGRGTPVAVIILIAVLLHPFLLHSAQKNNTNPSTSKSKLHHL